MELIRYDAACKALAAAVKVDEVKGIRDKGIALKACARQAKNRQLEIDASIIRVRAERRLGELIREQKSNQGLNRGSKGQLKKGQIPKGSKAFGDSQKGLPKESIPTLKEAGISLKLSSKAQKLASIPEETFEKGIAAWKEQTESDTKPVTIPKPEKSEMQKKLEEIGRRPSPWKDITCVLEAVRITESVRSASADRVVEYLKEFPEEQEKFLDMGDFWSLFVRNIRALGQL